jgi:hypothetical protein
LIKRPLGREVIGMAQTLAQRLLARGRRKVVRRKKAVARKKAVGKAKLRRKASLKVGRKTFKSQKAKMAYLRSLRRAQ